jgi:hypothetical protein
MARPSHPPRLDYSNYTWRRVQITKLLVMQFSPFSRHLIPLLSTMAITIYKVQNYKSSYPEAHDVGYSVAQYDF